MHDNLNLQDDQDDFDSEMVKVPAKERVKRITALMDAKDRPEPPASK